MESETCSAGGTPLAAGLAAETARGFDSKTRFPHRIARMAAAKERSVAMGEHIAASPHRLELRKERQELGECRNYLVFRSYTTRDAIRLHGVRSCRKHLLCPCCAIARGSRLLQAYIPKHAQLVAADEHLRSQMITLTVVDGPNLEERFRHLVRSLRELMKRRHRARGSEAERILGAVYSVEVKRGTGSGQWHPHVHMFALVDELAPVRPGVLAAEWRAITGDSYILDVHDVYGDPADAFCEVFKYAVKFSDLSFDDTLDAYRVLRGRHLIGTFGIFYGVEVNEELADDLLDDESLPFLDVMFRYCGRNLGYVHTGIVGSNEREAA